MFKALLGETPAILPAAPCYPSLFLADAERAIYIDQYRRCLAGRTRYPVNHAQDTEFRARALRESYAIFKARPDWIEVGRGASKAWAERMDIVVCDEVLCYEDKRSGVRVPMHIIPIPYGDAVLSGDSSSSHDLWDISARLLCEGDVDEQLPITTAVQLLERGDFDLPRLVAAEQGEEYFVSTVLDTPFSDAYDLLGFQGLMLIQYDRPELFHYLLQRKLAQTCEVMAAWAEAGVHGVYVEEVFTGADIISPRSYDRYVFAYNQPYFQHMHGLGLLPIHYVCGDVIPRLDRIVEYDIAAVAVEESKKNFRIEIEDVVSRVAGRAAVFGNIDAVRFGIHASPSEMAAEVKRQAGIGAKARGFIVSTGSPFPLNTDPRLIDTLVAAAHSFTGSSPAGQGK
jgi:hypothetical protein